MKTNSLYEFSMSSWGWDRIATLHGFIGEYGHFDSLTKSGNADEVAVARDTVNNIRSIVKDSLVTLMGMPGDHVIDLRGYNIPDDFVVELRMAVVGCEMAEMEGMVHIFDYMTPANHPVLVAWEKFLLDRQTEGKLEEARGPEKLGSVADAFEAALASAMA